MESLEESIRANVDGKDVVLSFSHQAFVTTREGLIQFSVPIRNVLWIHVGDSLEVAALREKGGKLVLVSLTGRVNAADVGKAKTWADRAMKVAYNGIKQQKRLKVLVNPKGGQGKGRAIYEKTVQPILEAARCTIDVVYTEYSKHAHKICSELPLHYDAILTLSGDGLIHEVLNGLGSRTDAHQAFEIPIVPIPTGSANGLCINLIGIKDGFDVATLCLNALKGQPMKLDLCSISQGDKQVWSFMSQALGLMADLDLGTEHLRWMGDGRFILGFLQGVLALKTCPISLSIKLFDADKDRMAAVARAAKKGLASDTDNAPKNEPLVVPPELTPDPEEGEGWYKFNKPILYVYGGKVPYVARDLMQFPVAQSDGLVDVVVQENCNRKDLIAAIGVAPQGGQYWITSQHYFKAHAFRVKPLAKKGYLSIDGESYPFEPFNVEVKPALATTLSPTGSFNAPF